MLFPIGDDNSTRRTFPLVILLLILANALFFIAELALGEAFIVQWSFVPQRFLANPVALEEGWKSWYIYFNFHDLEIARVEPLSQQSRRSRHHLLHASSQAEGQILSSVFYRLPLSH